MQVADRLTALRRRVAARPLLVVVLALAAVALLARLAFLGDRIAHYDEGRVAYWALHYGETGEIAYRYIVHGTFVQYVGAVFFALFGYSDAVARLPLALFGGLLPLGALLFRSRLRDVEVAGLAAVLALNPVLLYYSRFLRSTLLVAGFCFLAFGCAVRAMDTRRLRYVYAASVLLALAFAAKENAVVYLLVWVGALGVLAIQALFWPWRDRTARERLSEARGWLVERVRGSGREARRRIAGHAVGVVAVFVLVALFFYAPRNPAEGVGLWQAVGDPTKFPALFDATVADVVEGYSYWFGGSTEPGCFEDTLLGSYVCYLESLIGTFTVAAASLTLLAVGGFALELYGRQRPRPLVVFAAAWGTASVLGYPLGMDVQAGWVAVNAIVPLAIVAAVGLGWLLREGWAARAEGDWTSVLVVAIVVAALAVQVGAVASEDVYREPVDDYRDHVLVQFAQPADDYRPVFERAATVAGEEPGPHVVVHGDTLRGQSAIPPSCLDLRGGLPIHWYLASNELSATCGGDETVGNATTVDATGDDRRVPVVITGDPDSALRSQLSDYVERSYHNRAIGGEFTAFVRPDVAEGTDLGGHAPSDPGTH